MPLILQNAFALHWPLRNYMRVLEFRCFNTRADQHLWKKLS